MSQDTTDRQTDWEIDDLARDLDRVMRGLQEDAERIEKLRDAVRAEHEAGTNFRGSALTQNVRSALLGAFNTSGWIAAVETAMNDAERIVFGR